MNCRQNWPSPLRTFLQRPTGQPLLAALVELGRLAMPRILLAAAAILVSSPAGPVPIQPLRFDLLSLTTARLPDASATRSAPARRNRPGKFAHPLEMQLAETDT